MRLHISIKRIPYLTVFFLGVWSTPSNCEVPINSRPICSGSKSVAKPWYESWLLIPQSFSAEQIAEGQKLALSVGDLVESSLKASESHFSNLLICMREFGSSWQSGKFSDTCKSSSDFQRYYSLIFEDIPMHYRILRLNVAMAFPPTTYSGGQRLWDFNEQVNVALRAPREWPLLSRLEPLLDDPDPNKPDEIESAKGSFFENWKRLIKKHVSRIEAIVATLRQEELRSPELRRHERLLDQLTEALNQTDPERRAYLAATISDPNWQDILQKEFAELRIGYLADLVKTIDEFRPLAVLNSAMPQPQDLVNMFEQMKAANLAAQKQLKAEQDELRSTADSRVRRKLIDKYLGLTQLLAEVLALNSENCDLVYAMLESRRVEELNHLIDDVITYGAMVFALPVSLSTMGFLALNTMWILDADRELNENKQRLIATLDPSRNPVGALDTYISGHQEKMLYLGYPLVFAGTLTVGAFARRHFLTVFQRVLGGPVPQLGLARGGGPFGFLKVK